MKKFFALAVSALMLIAMVPSAMAADATVVMYEPDVLSNLNSITVGSNLGTGKVTGSWATYSGAKHGAVFVAEDTGNRYVKLTDAEISGSATTTTGEYGAFFQMNDTAVTGENITFEMKVKIPETNKKRVELKFRGDYLFNGAEHPESTSYSSGVYAVAHIAVTDDGYVYNDYHTDGSTSSIVTLAPYSEQWIALKWVFNTTGNSYDLYCNGEKATTVSDAMFYPNGVITGSSNVVPSNLKYIQVCLPDGTKTYSEDGKTLLSKKADGGEIWIDDLVFDASATTDAPLSAVIPTFKSVENETANTGLVNVALLNSDSTAYGKEIGIIIPAVDTSMVGTYTVPVENISGVNTTWDVYRTSTVTGYNFDNDENPYVQKSDSNSSTNKIEQLNGGNVLKLGAPVDTNRNYEYIDINPNTGVSTDYDIFELSFDMYWTKPGVSQTFYSNLYKTGRTNLALEVAYTLDTDGTVVAKTNSKELLRATLPATGEMHNFRYVFDRKNDTMKSYLNNSLISTWSFSDLGGAGTSGSKIQYIEDVIGSIVFNTYAASSYTTETHYSKFVDLYIDNLYVNAYETVVSVDTTGVATEVSVVKNRVPALTQTVPSTLTDGTFDVLPIKWAAVDTATIGEKNVTGVVQGIADTTVSATVTVIELPYTVNVADGTITINAPTDYKPEGKLYIATYDDNDALTGVAIYDTPITDSTTVSAEGNIRVFLLTDTLEPLAEDAE